METVSKALLLPSGPATIRSDFNSKTHKCSFPHCEITLHSKVTNFTHATVKKKNNNNGATQQMLIKNRKKLYLFDSPNVQANLGCDADVVVGCDCDGDGDCGVFISFVCRLLT